MKEMNKMNTLQKAEKNLWNSSKTTRKIPLSPSKFFPLQ